uniref:Uncharacterized protein n=1 Tax=Anguilla anguilla TaxID=7936 RepID=A0A0E9X4Z7_ANGAN
MNSNKVPKAFRSKTAPQCHIFTSRDRDTRDSSVSVGIRSPNKSSNDVEPTCHLMTVDVFFCQAFIQMAC